MLKALRAGLGFRVATAIAVFAALCLIAPPAVMAFGHGKTTAHCLTNADVAGHGMHKTATPKRMSLFKRNWARGTGRTSSAAATAQVM